MRLPHFAAALGAVSLLSFAAAACSEGSSATEAPPSAEASFEPPPPVESNALPDDATPSATASAATLDVALTPEAEKGEKGARRALLAWARALELGRYDEAYAQWGDGGRRSGMSVAQYAAQFARFETLTVGVGEGAVEGAAGSLYYEVPVTFTGRRRDGTRLNRTGTVVARRVNDVDGATPAQLRWHLESTTLRL